MRQAFQRLSALVLFFFMALATPAFADLPQETEVSKVKVQFLVDQTALAPGETARVGVRLSPEKDWHVYWKFPGETGLPTQVHFNAPDGVSFGATEWGLPQRFVDALGGVSYGFENELVLFSSITLPDDLQEGTEMLLSASVGWLVCKTNCIQGKAEVGLTLPIQATALEERLDSNVAALFDAWEKKHPLSPEDAPETRVTGPKALVAPGNVFELRYKVAEANAEGFAWQSPLEEAFIPEQDGFQILEVGEEKSDDGKSLLVKLKASSRKDKQREELPAILRGTQNGEPLAWQVSAAIERAHVAVEAALPVSAARTATAITPAFTAPDAGVCEDVPALGAPSSPPISSLAFAFLFAFLGGLLLNAMPCVLPVLSLKIMGIIEQSQESPKKIWRHGLFYTAGVLLSFLAMAILLLLLQESSWAFQLQDPLFVGVFTAVVFAFALSLFGVFDIALPGASRLDQAVAKSSGYTSSFNYGVFAVLLGTPCTAPFLGPALTFAFTQPPQIMVSLLLMVGLGLAFPFLLLARFPAWTRLMPKPGPWLLTFKKLMGFLLVGTAVFLLYVFAALVSRQALMSYLIFLTVFAFALWVYGHWTSPARETRTRIIGTLSAVLMTVFAVTQFISFDPPENTGPTLTAGGITWHDFSQIDVNQEAEDGRLVFLDFTADWCTTCKVNEAAALHTDAVRQIFSDLNVLPVKADFTLPNPEISKWLEKYNEPSVPLYVVIPAKQPERAFKLPTLLSERDVKSGLCDAHKLEPQQVEAM